MIKAMASRKTGSVKLNKRGRGEPNLKNINFFMDKNLKLACDMRADMAGMSRTQYIIQLVRADMLNVDKPFVIPVNHDRANMELKSIHINITVKIELYPQIQDRINQLHLRLSAYLTHLLRKDLAKASKVLEVVMK